jgi:hypothetical protein
VEDVVNNGFLSFNGQWMMQHLVGMNLISSYRSHFEEVLEVIDSIAFRAMDGICLFKDVMLMLVAVKNW